MAQTNLVPVRNRNRRTSCSALTLCEQVLWDLDTEVSRKVASALSGDHRDALVDVDPRVYSCVDAFWRDWLAVSLVKKFPGLQLGVDTAEEAYTAFFEAEASCRLVNANLASDIVRPSIGLTVASYIHTARRNVSDVLGDFDWATAEDYFAFSAGASTRLPRRRGAPFHKYSGKPETTPTALPLAIAAVKRVPLWARQMTEMYGEDARKWFKLTLGSRITTVPKTAKTDRTIAIEPCMNMFLQKGIGGMIRRRLKKVGVDLDDQTRNQVLAREGSLDGRLATIDLSAASDSVSLELVRLLLPPDWYDAIVLTRSEFGFLRGKYHRFEKVSSMGNGFTFELESLIFWALSKAVLSLHDASDRRLAVYGDDIVISCDVVHHLIDLFSAVGFKTNVSKSFVDGPFRESCGKHYFHGIDVTPIYVKAPIDCDVRLIWFANSIRRWAARPTYPYCDTRFRTAYDRTVALISNGNRQVRIPDGVGDGGLIGTFDEARPSYSRRKAAFSVEVLAEVYRKWRPDGVPALLTYFQGVSKSLGGGSSSGQTELMLVSSTGRYIKSKMFLSQWAESPFW